MALSIAIDGPGGAGKSTISDGVAEALGILHLDTGALYRALGLKMLRNGQDPLRGELAEEMLADTNVSVRFAQGKQVTLLDGEDVSAAIRAPEVSAAASAVSLHQTVRARMVALQRQIAQTTDMVLDGRDIGTRVLPNATCKIYLTADVTVRAHRRFDEFQANSGTRDAPEFAKVLADLTARDKQDMSREIDPLRPAEDSIVVDTTAFSRREVIETVLAHVRACQGKAEGAQ